jgi:putative Mg2+ transporter-C (MgtC) family protein
MSNWWHGVARDFSDLPDPSALLRMAVRLLVAAVLGGAIGLERERRGKEAGMRTHMLAALEAALFVLAPGSAGASPEHLTRVVQGVTVSIGFVGAGAILKVSRTQHVRGLTPRRERGQSSAIEVFMTSVVYSGSAPRTVFGQGGAVGLNVNKRYIRPPISTILNP